MDSKITTYLVPIDFTFETENALMFALALAEKQAHKVVLLHIIANESERIAAEMKLSELAGKYNEFDIEATVIVGNVFHDIGVIAEGIGASLIVLGTHGEVGLLSKVLGSKTMRVLANSKVPMIIAQKETRFHTIKTIVMTLDLEKESIQVVKHATKIGQLFDSKVVLVAAEQEDEFLKRKIDLNLKLSRDYLNEHGLNTEIHLVSAKGYVKNLLAYCEEIGADMLAATYYQDSFFSFSEHLVKALAVNPLQIPLMTFDGESTSTGSQFGFLTV
jgi:nucleotide-binding universal stress UspA family protein